MNIRRIRALEILDSRGNPTLSVEVELSNSAVGETKVPSGASRGAHEAVELRDGEARRYAGLGVRRAIENVEKILAPALAGKEIPDLCALDRFMIELDGTPNKSRLGANAILGISCAAARALARAQGLPLWQYLKGARRATLPVPMVNILSGGLHAGSQIEFQDFLAAPRGFPTYSAALEAMVAVHRAAREVIESRRYRITGVADEGGWGPRFPSNEAAIEVLAQAISRAGLRPREEVSIAIDAASSHFYREGAYHLRSERRTLTSDEMVRLFADWVDRYPITSIEDGLAEDDWDGWKRLTDELGGRVQLIGDDLFATNPARLENGIRRGIATAVLVKMNQIGTLTETFEVVDMARQANYAAVISARSGETEDAFLADLAVASGAGQIKIGSVTRSERLAKYNRLLEIERDGEVPYFGSS